MPATNPDITPEKPLSSPDIKFHWWEMVVIAIGALIGFAYDEGAIGIISGLICSSAVSTYVDRKNPKSPTVVRIVGVVFAIVMLALLVRMSVVLHRS